MTVALEPPAVAPSRARTGERSGFAVACLIVALAAGGALLVGGAPPKKAPPGGRISAAQAWPKAQRADLPGSLADGPLFTPAVFLDTKTAVGTAPSPDARSVRLIFRSADGGVRELERLPAEDNPVFDSFAVAGDQVIWTQSTQKVPLQIWAADVRAGGAARRLTTETGNAVFYGTQYDLVVAEGRVFWTAAPGRSEVTEIRSVPLTGGPVRIRTEPGEWSLTAWPWLRDDAANQSGTTRLRNMSTGRDVDVRFSAGELTTCSPAWCVVMVMNDTGLVRIDLMHPDGSARRRIAGGGAQAAVTDVAILDRFEILSEAGPGSDLTGTAGLVVFDISSGRTVALSAAADGAYTRNGMLWWSTGGPDNAVWHSLDLRTA